MIPLVPMPSALCSTIRARQTCFWATLRSPTSASRRRRSAGLKMMLIPGRMSQAMAWNRRIERSWGRRRLAHRESGGNPTRDSNVRFYPLVSRTSRRLAGAVRSPRGAKASGDALPARRMDRSGHLQTDERNETVTCLLVQSTASRIASTSCSSRASRCSRSSPLWSHCGSRTDLPAELSFAGGYSPSTGRRSPLVMT